MAIILTDHPVFRKSLLPFTYTRPVSEIRTGIFTIREKWEKTMGQTVGFLTLPYLSGKFPHLHADENLYLNGGLIPTSELVSEIKDLPEGIALVHKKTVLAYRTSNELETIVSFEFLREGKTREVKSKPFLIQFPWEIFSRNGEAFLEDMKLLDKTFLPNPEFPGLVIIGNPEHLKVEPGAKIGPCIINVETGPVVVGKNAEIMEGCLVRGPLYLGEGAILKMGAKIYGPTTIGPHCKVGGEVNNSVIFGNSNKAHDGFLGNSVIGEWCNLGADTNNSNLKNNYSEVRIWDYASGEFRNTGLQFCGIMMGDHTKCAINTTFNTGTVIGVNANVFGFGFPSKFVPSFSWDGADQLDTYNLETACEVAERVMSRRNTPFTADDRKILESVFLESAPYRHWEAGKEK